MSRVISITGNPHITQSSGEITGINPWSNTDNAMAQDNSFATVTMSSGDESQHLVTRDYRFSIPPTATITGISASVQLGEVQGSPDATGCCLWYQDTQLGDTQPLTTLDESGVSKAFGDGSTTLGASLTTAVVTGRDFGFAFNATASSNGTIVEVDVVYLTVTYRLGASSARSRRRDMRRYR